MSGLFTSMDISATGMSLQRRKMNVVAENIANAETTQTKEGGPYRRKRVTVAESRSNTPFKIAMTQARSKLSRTNTRHLSGTSRMRNDEIEISKVKSKEVQDPATRFRLVHDPDHPDADADGYVKMPDIEIVTEMVDMIAASRGYEANTTAILSAKEMARNALDI